MVELICTCTPASMACFTPRTAPVERSLHATELVVELGSGEIDGDGDARDADGLHLAGHFGGHQCAVRRHDHPQAGVVDAVLGELPDVISHERVAPGHDQDRIRERGNVVKERLALGGGQLSWVRSLLRGGPAVTTGEIAGARDLPGDELGEILRVPLRHRSGRLHIERSLHLRPRGAYGFPRSQRSPAVGSWAAPARLARWASAQPSTARRPSRDR